MLLLRGSKFCTSITTNTTRGIRGPARPPKHPYLTGTPISEDGPMEEVSDKRGRPRKGKHTLLEQVAKQQSTFDTKHALAPLTDHGSHETKRTKVDIPYPKEIVAYLDEFVVGQDLAKKTLAVGVYQHYKRVDFNLVQEERSFVREALRHSMDRKHRKAKGKIPVDRYDYEEPIAMPSKGFTVKSDDAELSLDKSNIVLLGPSGSGKTYLTQKLAEALNVPFAMCDCTTLTQAGYVGDDVESVVQKLVAHSNGDVMSAERGIVFLDEFDKIYTSSDPMHTGGNRDVSGKGVQQALLKLVEGTRVIIKHPLQPNAKIELDTSNILFVASGAFSNLERIVARRLDNRSLGFTASGQNLNEELNETDEVKAASSKNNLLVLCDHGDLINFGMVPELVGRFPVLVPFHSLSEKMLQEILTEPKNNIIDQAKKLFELDGITLEFTDCAVEELARLAVKRKTGARALRSIIERVLLQAKYECPGTVRGTVTITGAVVRGEQEYLRTIL